MNEKSTEYRHLFNTRIETERISMQFLSLKSESSMF